MTERTCLRLTQHKRFVPYGTHPNPSLSLRTSFMLESLGVIGGKGLMNKKDEDKYKMRFTYGNSKKG